MLTVARGVHLPAAYLDSGLSTSAPGGLAEGGRGSVGVCGRMDARQVPPDQQGFVAHPVSLFSPLLSWFYVEFSNSSKPDPRLAALMIDSGRHGGGAGFRPF